MSSPAPPPEGGTGGPRTARPTPPLPARPKWQRTLGQLASLATLAVALPALAGFAGRAWWVFELMSHFRAQYFGGLLVGTILLLVARCYCRAIAAATLLAVHAALLAPFYLPVDRPLKAEGGARLRLLISNVHAANEEYDKVLTLVRDRSPEVAVFVEVNERWGAALETLADDWPHSHVVAQPGNFGVAIFSRLPLEEPRVEEFRGHPAIITRIDVQGTPVTIFAAHPVPPVSARISATRNRQLAGLADLVAETPGEKLIAGDLNTTSWSPAFADLIAQTNLVDSRRGMGIQPSWRADLPSVFGIPIDHCLVSKGIHVARRELGPDVGSDHLPVIVDLEIGAAK